MKGRCFCQFAGVILLAMSAVYSHDASATYYHGAKEYVAVPDVQWAPCFQDFGPFECATYTVPLDHSRASRFFYLWGHQPGIELSLIRLPASDTENKIGSLLLNPGGPGGSGSRRGRICCIVAASYSRPLIIV